MKSRIMLIAVAFFLSLGAGFSADTGIDGRWMGRFRSGMDGPMDMDYMFKAYGNFLTGTTIGGSNGERIPILNGSINGKKVSFTVMLSRITVVPSQFQVTIQQMKYDYTGDISGDTLKLKFIINGDKRNGGSFTVKREKKKDSLSPTQQNFDYESERQRAFELYKKQNLLEARPILEQLFDARPDDGETLEALAFATMATIIEVKDTATQNAIRLQARAMAERAKELGQNSALLQQFIELIRPDGTLSVANTAMKPSPAMEALTAAEVEFNSGRMEQAIAHYERAAQLDPGLYEVPLFTGDAYYSLNQKEKAYEYYARAVAINPDRETAWRYWGNVLMSENRLDEAKEKLIESIICEPYSRLPWQFLANWAERANIQLAGHPRIDIPENKESRQSLPEEYHALSAVVESVMTQLKEGAVSERDLSESLANLLKLHNDELLEAYIFLARPNEGIARDYAEYRKYNRDKLRRYMNEYVIVKR